MKMALAPAPQTSCNNSNISPNKNSMDPWNHTTRSIPNNTNKTTWIPSHAIWDWNKMFMALALYKKRHGSVQSLLLLSNTSSSNDPSSRLAAIWLRYQVLNRYHLAKDQVQKLSSLGYPGIQGDLQTMTARNTPAEVILEYMYAKLLAFQREFGHTQVPTDWERDPTFAKWVMEQRLKMENQTLSQEHCHLLGQLGFEWSLEQVHPTASTAAEAVAADSTAESNVFPDDDEWMVNFQKLVLFQSKYKHCDVPLVLEQDHTFSDRHKSFSEWVLQQHLLHLNNNLPPKRRKLLDKIGFFEPEIAGIHTNKKKRAQPDPGDKNEKGTMVVDLTDCDDDGDDNRKGQQPTQKKSKTDQHTSEEMLQYSKSYIAKLRAKVGLTTLKMTSTLGSKNKSMATNTAAAASVPNREAAVSPARGPPKRRSEKSGPTAGNKQPSTTTASGMGMMMTNEPTAMSSLGHNDNARPTSSSTRNAKITHGTSSTMNAKIMAEQQQKYQHFLKQQQQQQQQPASAPPPSDVAAVSKEQNDKETTNENNNKHTAWYMMEKLGDENRHLQEQLQRQTEDLHRHQDDLRRKDAVIAYLKQQLQEKDRYIESVTDMEDAIFLF